MQPTPRLRPLDAFLSQHGLPHDASTLTQFDLYLSLLKQGNKAMNLIGPLSDAEIVHDLLCDSLSIAALLNPLPPVIIDIGSGAGFPGLPLKILSPSVSLHLVEPRQKRYHFQGIAARALKLTGVTRHNARVEDCAPNLPPSALVCSKAFAPVEQWLPIAASLAAPSGFVAVLCAEDHWTADRDAQARALGLSILHRLVTPRHGSPPRLTLILSMSS
jgi:16S rRNA (guanine527-N7)-methyltransferase